MITAFSSQKVELGFF